MKKNKIDGDQILQSLSLIKKTMQISIIIYGDVYHTTYHLQQMIRINPILCCQSIDNDYNPEFRKCFRFLDDLDEIHSDSFLNVFLYNAGSSEKEV